MRRDDVDIFIVERRHDEIDARLRNWGAWAAVRPYYAMSPMFRALGYRSNAWQWHPPAYRESIDLLDARAIESTVSKLPEPHRTVVRWFYVYRFPDARKFGHKMGMNLDTLRQCCNTARDMVANTAKRL